MLATKQCSGIYANCDQVVCCLPLLQGAYVDPPPPVPRKRSQIISAMAPGARRCGKPLLLNLEKCLVPEQHCSPTLKSPSSQSVTSSFCLTCCSLVVTTPGVPPLTAAEAAAMEQQRQALLQQQREQESQRAQQAAERQRQQEAAAVAAAAAARQQQEEQEAAR